jgi:hypothetical protein
MTSTAAGPTIQTAQDEVWLIRRTTEESPTIWAVDTNSGHEIRHIGHSYLPRMEHSNWEGPFDEGTDAADNKAVIASCTEMRNHFAAPEWRGRGRTIGARPCEQTRAVAGMEGSLVQEERMESSLEPTKAT